MFLICLMNYLLRRRIDLLIYVLTKHVKFPRQLLELQSGKIGQTQLGFMLTHITITNTMPQMKFVENGVILHQKMVVSVNS
jgi:hypothetical protein